MSDGHDDPRQYFTPQEANQRLPLVRAIVADIVTLFKDLHERRERLNELRHRSEQSEYRDEVIAMEQKLVSDVETLEAYVEELKQLGVDLKDPLVGLVDFRMQFEGREVDLCWKLGEDAVNFWHETDAGFAGRQPVTTLEQTAAAPANGNDDIETS